jgi:poly(A) polymerase
MLNSNKLGFLGGINFAIMAVYACQIAPNLNAAGCLRVLFRELAEWRWPTPLRLTVPYTRPEINLPQWDPMSNPWDLKDLMSHWPLAACFF